MTAPLKPADVEGFGCTEDSGMPGTEAIKILYKNYKQYLDNSISKGEEVQFLYRKPAGSWLIRPGTNGAMLCIKLADNRVVKWKIRNSNPNFNDVLKHTPNFRLDQRIVKPSAASLSSTTAAVIQGSSGPVTAVCPISTKLVASLAAVTGPMSMTNVEQQQGGEKSHLYQKRRKQGKQSEHVTHEPNLKKAKKKSETPDVDNKRGLKRKASEESRPEDLTKGLYKSSQSSRGEIVEKDGVLSKFSLPLELERITEAYSVDPVEIIKALENLEPGEDLNQFYKDIAGKLDVLDLSSYYEKIKDLSKILELFKNVKVFTMPRHTKNQDLEHVAKLTNLNTLNLSNCSALTDIIPLSNLTNLNTLHLSECYALTDIGPLSTLTKLNTLNLRCCNALTDIRPLSNLTNLNTLDLSWCRALTDVRPLSTLTNLNTLNLSWCGKFTDIGPLSTLTNLNTLNLRSCNELTDIVPLSTLINLNNLNLGYCPATDIRPLSTLTNLNTLDLSYCQWRTDIRPLSTLTNLNTLDLSYCPSLRDIRPLSNLTNLGTLNLRSCDELTDIVPLSTLINLNNLNLGYCPAIDIRPLSTITNLNTLDLSYCQARTDIRPLSNLTNLNTLDLSFCRRIKDARPLSTLTNLEKLDLNLSEITDIGPLSTLTTLKSLNLLGCKGIEEIISPLSKLANLKFLSLRGCDRIKKDEFINLEALLKIKIDT